MAFPAGVFISTIKGGTAIDLVRENHRILTHRFRVREVTHVLKTWFDGELVQVMALGSNFPLLCTPDQRFFGHNPWTDENVWAQADDLKPGDYIVSRAVSGLTVASSVLSVERVPFAGEVFDLMVKDDASFVANGRIVHDASEA